MQLPAATRVCTVAIRLENAQPAQPLDAESELQQALIDWKGADSVEAGLIARQRVLKAREHIKAAGARSRYTACGHVVF